MRLSCFLIEAEAEEEQLSIPTVTFSYAKFKEDPEPTIFYMGQGIQPQSGKRIVGGLNLNYVRTRGPRVVEDVIRANLPVLVKAGAIAAWPAPGNLQAAFEAISRMLDNASESVKIPAKQVLGYSPYASQGVYRTYLVDEMQNIRTAEPLAPLTQTGYQQQQATRADKVAHSTSLAQAQTAQAKQTGRDQMKQIAPDVDISTDRPALDLQPEPGDEPLEILDVDSILGQQEPQEQEPQGTEVLDVDGILGLNEPESPQTPPKKSRPRTSPQRRRFR